MLTALALLLVARAGDAATHTHSSKMLIQSGGSLSSEYYAERGFTHQLVGSVAPFASYSGVPGSPFVSGSAAEKWRSEEIAKTQAEIAANTAAGIETLSSMDIFVLPKGIVDANCHAIVENCSSTTRKIALNNFTIGLMNTMLAETFATFDGLSGIVVRVGENYGGPKSPVQWVGNGAVEFHQRQSRVQAQYRLFIRALRQIVCVLHNKTLVFRTWDSKSSSLYTQLAISSVSRLAELPRSPAMPFDWLDTRTQRLGSAQAILRGSTHPENTILMSPSQLLLIPSSSSQSSTSRLTSGGSSVGTHPLPRGVTSS